MLRCVYGPFHDLERALVERLAVPKPGGRPLAVVTPSRRLADRVQRACVVEAGKPLLGVHFHTFHSLAALLAEEGVSLEGAVVSDPVFHDAVVDGLLEERPELARAFGGAARPRALASALRSSLRDLIDAGVRPEDVREHFGDGLVSDEHDRLRLTALLGLLEAYDARLADLGVLTTSAVARAAARAAARSSFLGGLDGLIYYGAYDMTGLQLELLEAAAAVTETTFMLPYRRAHPAFKFVDPFFEQKLAAEARPVAAAAAPPAVAAALDVLFTGGAGARVGLEALDLASASGARDEAWFCAKEILALAQAGTRYEDIAVIARSLEPYRAVLAEVFADSGIPLDLGAGEPLLRRPAAKFALNLLSLRRRDLPADVVLDLAGSPYFARRPNARRLRHWRALVERLGIRAGWLQWRKLETRSGKPLELRPERRRETGKGYEIPAEDVTALWDLVAGWQAELGAPPRGWSELSRAALAVLERDLGLPADAEEAERGAVEAVRAACADLARFDRLGRPASWEGFLEALEDKLRRAELAASPARGVRALGAMDARGESFPVVFLIGLKEKAFPRAIQEDPVLRDAERAALRHPGGWWLSTKAAGYEEERLLFYLSAAAARRKLYCVYPRSDESGKAEVASLYLRELCRAAGRDLATARRVPRLPIDKLASVPLSALSPREAGLALVWNGGPAARALTAGGLDGVWLEAGLEAAARLNAGGPAGPLDGVVGPPKAFLDGAVSAGLSPSAFDMLARCEFQFFAERLLGLGRPQEPAEAGELADWMRGQIYHEALERFHRLLLEARFWDDPGADHVPALEQALAETFAARDWRELGVYPLLWRGWRDRMERSLRGFAAWDVARAKETGLRPLWLEKSLEGALPADAPGAAAGLRVRGRLDRVDADAERTRFSVVDYKTRWAPKTKLGTLLSKGDRHQLPLYAELSGLELGPGAAFDSAWIYAIEDSPEATGRPRGHAIDALEWTATRPGFLETLADRMERLAAGVFPIRPDDSEFGHCRFCDFGAMCRKAHGPSRARAARGAA